MEKISRPKLKDISSLTLLQINWKQWGWDYKDFIEGDKTKGIGVAWSWRQGIYSELRTQLALLTQEHCSFCDGYPIGETSKETIEHYKPKDIAPLLAYFWWNLFYCCDKCQSEANKQKPFRATLKPDMESYTFDSYFYFDLETGKLNVLENLEIDAPDEYSKANDFLDRYGINTNPKRNKARQHLFLDIKNFHKKPDARIRNDFKYRYIFDLVRELS